MSSAESFVLMLAQAPNVTTMGDHTAGSSGNPRQLQLPGEIVVTLPRWMDLKPDRTPLDHVGVEPDVWIDAPVDAFTNKRDPVLEAALQRLQEIPASERVPGKRSSTHERVR
jgi:C-terminal processing protease CtpA/Prc